MTNAPDWLQQGAAALEAQRLAVLEEEELEHGPKLRRPRSEWGAGAGLKRTVCVCRLFNKGTGRSLVAKTTHLYNYGLLLMSRLRRGKHGNKALQLDYDRFGVDAFSLQVLQGCDERLLDDTFNEWVRRLDAYNPMFGYNRAPRHHLATPEERAARVVRQERHWKHVRAARARKAARAARRKAKLDRRVLKFDELPVRMSNRAAREAAKRPVPPALAPVKLDPEAAAREWARSVGLDWDRLVTG